jgi:hypothetical protein
MELVKDRTHWLDSLTVLNFRLLPPFSLFDPRDLKMELLKEHPYSFNLTCKGASVLTCTLGRFRVYDVYLGM